MTYARVFGGCQSIAENPVVPGGCPLLNTAIESDDANGAAYAELRKRTRGGMRRLIGYVRRIIEHYHRILVSAPAMTLIAERCGDA